MEGDTAWRYYILKGRFLQTLGGNLWPTQIVNVQKKWREILQTTNQNSSNSYLDNTWSKLLLTYCMPHIKAGLCLRCWTTFWLAWAEATENAFLPSQYCLLEKQFLGSGSRWYIRMFEPRMQGTHEGIWSKTLAVPLRRRYTWMLSASVQETTEIRAPTWPSLTEGHWVSQSLYKQL